MPGGYGKGNRYRWWNRGTETREWPSDNNQSDQYQPYGYRYNDMRPAESSTMSKKDELKMLEEELERIKDRIEEIKKELKR